MVMLATAIMVVAGARPAFACQCVDKVEAPARSSPETALFVGTMTRQRFAFWRTFRATTEFRFDVEAVVTGDIHESILVVPKPGASSSCGGFHANKGERVGVNVSRVGDRWEANRCSRLDPASVLALPGVHAPAPGATPGPSWATRLAESAPWLIVALVASALLLWSRSTRARE